MNRHKQKNRKSTITGGTINLAAGAQASYFELANHMNTNKLDFFCVPDAPELSTFQQQQLLTLDYNVITTHELEGRKNTAVAIIYRRKTFTAHHNTFMDPSRRLLTVDLEPAFSKQRLRIIAVYFPPNIDNIKPLSDVELQTENTKHNFLQTPQKNVRIEAERLRIRCRQIAHQPGAYHSIITGDFNCTLYHNDRHPHKFLSAVDNMNSTLHRATIQDKWINLYDYINPNNFDEQDPKKNHTYFQIQGTSSSRIDHAFLWPPSHQHLCTACWVDHTATFTASDKDHHPLFYQLQHPTNNEYESTKTEAPWSPPASKIPKHWTPQIIQSISNELNKILSPMISSLITQLNKLQIASTQNIQIFDEIVQQFQSQLLSTFHNLSETHKPNLPKQSNYTKWPLPYVYACKARDLHQRLRSHIKTALTSGLPLYSPKIYNTRKRLSKMKNYHFVIDTILKTPFNTPYRGRWATWLLQSKQNHLQLLAMVNSTRPDNARRRQLFKTAKGRSHYYNTEQHQATSNIINHTIDDNNNLITEPSEYIPLIQEQMQNIFNVKFEGPVVGAWRPLSIREGKTGQPDWWKATYERNAMNLPPDFWNHLCDPPNISEVLTTLRNCSHDTSPGYDGISTDLLRLVTNTYLYNNKQHQQNPTSTAFFLKVYLETTFRLATLAPSLREGLISLLPKPNQPPQLAAHLRRPISLIPEMAKLPSRIYAKRILEARHQRPDLLHWAQRAYHNDGSIHQIIQALLSTAEFVKLNERTIFLTNYDISKAFDKIQMYSIIATLRRYNFPELFNQYIISTLQKAISRIRTFHGPTDPISLLTGVRQGDPLAALLFILVADPLHTGLTNNPLLHLANSEPQPISTGFTISSPQNDFNTITHSHGYGDDTNTTNETEEASRIQHLYVLDFLTAHRLTINTAKTSYLIYPTPLNTLTLPPQDPQLIHDPLHNVPIALNPPHNGLHPPLVSNIEPITSKPSNTSIRALGAQLNLDLDPNKTRLQLQAIFFKALKFIRQEHHTIPQASYFLREKLYPSLHLHLLSFPQPSKLLERWDSALLSTIFSVTSGSHVYSLSTAAKWISLGVPPLSSFEQISYTTTITDLLRIKRSPTGPLMRCLLSQNTQIRTDEIIMNQQQNLATTLYRPLQRQRSQSRIHKALHHLQKSNLFLVISPTLPQIPTPPLLHLGSLPLQLETLNAQEFPHFQRIIQIPTTTFQLEADDNNGVVVFTDGSYTSPKENGYAVIMLPARELTQDFSFSLTTCSVIHGTSTPASANYAAEVLAVLCALISIPLLIPITIYTDCQSLCEHLRNTRLISEAKLFNTGANLIVTEIKRIISLRQAPTNMNFVPAHTGATDVISRGNEFADKQAKIASKHLQLDPFRNKPFLSNAPPLLLVLRQELPQPNQQQLIIYNHFDSNLRSHLRKQVQQEKLQKWASLETQGQVLLRHPTALPAMLHHLRQTNNSKLFTFLLYASCDWLPTPVRTLRGLIDAPLLCPLCKHTKATTTHALSCTFHHTLQRTLQEQMKRQLQTLTQPLRSSTTSSLQQLRELSTNIISNFHWYTAKYLPTPLQYFGSDIPGALGQTFKTLAESHHPLSASLGFISKDLFNLYLPIASQLGLPPSQQKQFDKQRSQHKLDLQLLVLNQAYELYQQYKTSASQQYQSNLSYKPFLKRLLIKH
jgi:hypothetical protein